MVTQNTNINNHKDNIDFEVKLDQIDLNSRFQVGRIDVKEKKF